MNNQSELVEKIEFPLTRSKLQNIKEIYETEIINNFINKTIDKITYDVIAKAASVDAFSRQIIVGTSSNSSKTHEIINAFSYIFDRTTPHQVQLNYNEYFQIIIDKLKNRFGDVTISVYPPGNIEKRTCVHFDWS